MFVCLRVVSDCVGKEVVGESFLAHIFVSFSASEVALTGLFVSSASGRVRVCVLWLLPVTRGGGRTKNAAAPATAAAANGAAAISGRCASVTAPAGARGACGLGGRRSVRHRQLERHG